ncbi:MAG: protein-L-isoaspartate O-methyltransferase [Hyphomicrobium sp.]|nr:protein-L-isoaspartate O-methyltransferase [Hyphomicrobium sp.]
MTDTALQRKNMVESQVRPSDVTDRRITAAMQDLAREDFVPPALKPLAYMDEPIAVAPGRSLMAPRTFARLLQLADVDASDKVLIVGALTGYSAAVVARFAAEVVALESDAALAATAKSALSAKNVSLASGPLTDGWPAAAPFDVIIIEGGFELLPPQLLAQLSSAGRLVGIDVSGGVGRAVTIETVGAKDNVTTSRRVAFEAAAVCLPGFARSSAFTF